MNTSTAIVTCPQPSCKAPNPLDRVFCQKCNTYIPKQYLWTLGQPFSASSKGQLLGDRYLVVDRNIIFDTHPGLMPVTTEEIPTEIVPYLKLSAYQPQIPKVCGLLANYPSQNESIWLLEDVPIYNRGVSASGIGRLMPKLVDAWSETNITALRQINWLTQIVELWQPMVMEKVASTLLNVEYLRVEGSLVRILELVPDSQGSPTLSDLGNFWQRFLANVHPSLAAFWQRLCEQLVAGEYTSPEQLLDVLNKALHSCSNSYSYLYQIATRSDKGPTRSRNEDACYPGSGNFLNSISGKDLGLTIVCDGIGGHEGGNVASNMAIGSIHQDIVLSLTQQATWESKSVSHQLENFIRQANDRISQRNDSEQRHSRQRMGTTVVMAVNHAHEVYIAHVGDSRAYRITRTGCHQVTLDDDLAAREVRLGYALYREALQHASSGSLIQALGMGGSYNLHPTVQKFAIDEDCIFLLCSDGLSDRDRVEQYWETLAIPVLEGKKDLGTLSQELLKIGNDLNGHDNITLGLLYCKPQLSPEAERSPIPPPPAVVPPLPSSHQKTTLQLHQEATFVQKLSSGSSPVPAPPTSASTVSASRKPNLWKWGFLIPLALVAIGAMAIVGYKYNLFPGIFPNTGRSSPDPTPTSPEILPGQFYQTTQAIELISQSESGEKQSTKIPENAILKVLKRVDDNIRVQVCSPELSANGADKTQNVVDTSKIGLGSKPPLGNTGLVKTSELQNSVKEFQRDQLDLSNRVGKCFVRDDLK
jgi:serine/threonine protein phosphatase PrpC